MAVRVIPAPAHSSVAVDQEHTLTNAAGAKDMLVGANAAPGTNAMDPQEMPSPLELRAARAGADSAELANFWND